MDQDIYMAGARIKHEVLGDGQAAKSANSDPFLAEFNDLVTRYCWGEVWGREGLSRKTRSLLNVAMLSAMGRADGLKVHIRGGINNGCTADELKEVLLQVAIYCGVPAALEAFKVTRAVLEELGVDMNESEHEASHD